MKLHILVDLPCHSFCVFKVCVLYGREEVELQLLDSQEKAFGHIMASRLCHLPGSAKSLVHGKRHESPVIQAFPHWSWTLSGSIRPFWQRVRVKETQERALVLLVASSALVLPKCRHHKGEDRLRPGMTSPPEPARLHCLRTSTWDDPVSPIASASESVRSRGNRHLIKVIHVIKSFKLGGGGKSNHF